MNGLIIDAALETAGSAITQYVLPAISAYGIAEPLIQKVTKFGMKRKLGSKSARQIVRAYKKRKMSSKSSTSSKRSLPYRPYKKVIVRRRKKDYFKTSQLPTSSLGLHSGANHTRLVCDMGLKPKKSIGHIVFRENYTQILSSAAGACAYGEIFNACTRDQMLTSSTTGGALANDLRKGNIGLFSLNPNQKNTGSQTFSGTSVWGAYNFANDRIVLKNVDFFVDMTNLSNHAGWVEVEIYICKRDNGNNPYVTANNLLTTQTVTATGVGFPSAATVAGGITAISGSGYYNMSIVGARARDARTLGFEWKRCASKTFYIGAGGQQRFSGALKYNKILKMEEIAPGTGNPSVDFIKNYSICCVARVWGQVVLDTTGSPTYTYPTYGGVEIGFISNVVYNIGYLKDNSGRININVASNDIPFNAVAAKQAAVNYADASATYVAV